MPAAETYFPILLLFVIAVALAGAILLIARLITRFAIKPREGEAKYTVYESGVNPLGDARLRFSIKFYLVAMIFIIFDIEIVFFYPWGGRFPRHGERKPVHPLGDDRVCGDTRSRLCLRLAKGRTRLGLNR